MSTNKINTNYWGDLTKYYPRRVAMFQTSLFSTKTYRNVGDVCDAAVHPSRLRPWERAHRRLRSVNAFSCPQITPWWWTCRPRGPRPRSAAAPVPVPCSPRFCWRNWIACTPVCASAERYPYTKCVRPPSASQRSMFHRPFPKRVKKSGQGQCPFLLLRSEMGAPAIESCPAHVLPGGGPPRPRLRTWTEEVPIVLHHLRHRRVVDASLVHLRHHKIMAMTVSKSRSGAAGGGQWQHNPAALWLVVVCHVVLMLHPNQVRPHCRIPLRKTRMCTTNSGSWYSSCRRHWVRRRKESVVCGGATVAVATSCSIGKKFCGGVRCVTSLTHFKTKLI